MIEMYNYEKNTFQKKGFNRGLPSKINQYEFNLLLSDYIHTFYNSIPNQFNFYVEKATDLTSKINIIKEFLPNSKYIHIIRDGRNQVISEIKLRKKNGIPFGTSKHLYWSKSKVESKLKRSKKQLLKF